MRGFDWTTGFNLSVKAYNIEYDEMKAEITIPVFGTDKKDIKIDKQTRWGHNTLSIQIPDTKLTDSRKLSFDAPEVYDVNNTKANIRDGLLYIHIPFREKSKPTAIEIT